jgi:hypothetical protein
MTSNEASGRTRCSEVEASIVEKGLGILEGDERTQVLAHLKDCNRCQIEAERVAVTADVLLQLAPEIEPPLGIEARVFQRLRICVYRTPEVGGLPRNE